MITRSAKRKSILEHNSIPFQVSQKQIQSQSSISIESLDCAPPGNKVCEKAVFNIHIHVPSCDISTLNLSVPGMQPIVHVHLNKIPKNLELNSRNKSVKLTPTLGYQEPPFKNNSAEKNSVEVKNKTSQTCMTDNISEEIKNGSSENSKDSYSSNKSSHNKSSRSNKNDNNEIFKSSKKISSYTFDMKSIKLNKAVVVLTDISKTKYYKAAIDAYTANDQVENKGIDSNKNVGSHMVKQECLRSGTENIEGCYTGTADSTFDSRPSLESVNTPSSGGRLLTQLAEGCSFSEILNRFRLKNGNCLVDTLQCSDTMNYKYCPLTSGNFKNETEHIENFKTECLEEHDNEVLKFEACSFNEDDNENFQDRLEGLLTSDVCERVESIDVEDSKLLGFHKDTEYEESNDIEHLRNQSLDSDTGSDHSENTTNIWSVSGNVTADKETLNSSGLTSNVVSDRCNISTYEDICNVSETNQKDISNVNNSDLNLHEPEQPNLEMDKEEMKSKKLPSVSKSKSKQNKRSKSKPTKSHHSPSPKKMKQSNEKSETPHKKGSLPDGYIPLKASGPTKFGVVMLKRIQPYKHHDAKEFKNKMIFGDRVKRFSSPDHLLMYKVKQETSRIKVTTFIVETMRYKWDEMSYNVVMEVA